MNNTTLAVGGDVPLELVDGKAPTELRLFRAGVNPSTKGDYIFDGVAADAVMFTYRQMGRGWVIADYDHGSLQVKPTDPSASSKAAGRARLELRNGELWATDIRWTPAAKASIEAGEWPSISPAFQHGEDGRPTWVINFGLTGNPALHAPAELIAANVLRVALAAVAPADDVTEDAIAIAAGAEGDIQRLSVDMALAGQRIRELARGLQQQTNEHQTGLVALNDAGAQPAQPAAKATEDLKNMKKNRTPAEVAEFFGVTEDEAKMMMAGYAEMASVKQQGETMMSAVCLSVGLTSGAKQHDVVSRLSALSAFERSVFSATGEKDQEKALGAISGLISTQAQAHTAIAELAALKATSAKANIEAQLSAAKAEKKLTPAEFDDTSETGLRATALSMGDKGEGWLKAHLSKRVPHMVLSTNYTQPRTEPGSDLAATPPPKAARDQATGAVQLNGKSWEQLSNPEKHDLRMSDPTSYKALADDYAARHPEKAKTFTHLSHGQRPASLG